MLNAVLNVRCVSEHLAVGQVSATAFNEGSSRSHTIMRLTIESSERPGPEADPRLRVARTLSFLNLIDLAGSESAKVRHQPPVPEDLLNLC